MAPTIAAPINKTAPIRMTTKLAVSWIAPVETSNATALTGVGITQKNHVSVGGSPLAEIWSDEELCDPFVTISIKLTAVTVTSPDLLAVYELVPREGLEPTLPCGKRILSP